MRMLGVICSACVQFDDGHGGLRHAEESRMTEAIIQKIANGERCWRCTGAKELHTKLASGDIARAVLLWLSKRLALLRS